MPSTSINQCFYIMSEAVIVTEYRTVYKCRLCGERYYSGVTRSRKIALEHIAYTVNEKCLNLETPLLVEPHICKNGGIGVADFQGFEEIEI